MALDAAAGTASHGHVFHVYDEDLAAEVASQLAEPLAAGGAAVVLVTAEHARRIEAELATRGIDVDEARASGRWVHLDAHAALAEVIVDGRPDAQAFDRVVATAVRKTVGQGRPVQVLGEAVAVLWDAGNVAAAIALEELWNDLHRRLPFALLCAYRAESACADRCRDDFETMAALHSARAVVGTTEQRRFPRSLSAPAAARRHVGEVLRRWGRHDQIDTALVVVSELVGNAVTHAGSDAEVTLVALPDGTRISVADGSADPPAPRHPAPTDRGGRGLLLISRLARSWGSESTDGGKVVWAELS